MEKSRLKIAESIREKYRVTLKVYQSKNKGKMYSIVNKMYENDLKFLIEVLKENDIPYLIRELRKEVEFILGTNEESELTIIEADNRIILEIPKL